MVAQRQEKVDKRSRTRLILTVGLELYWAQKDSNQDGGLGKDGRESESPLVSASNRTHSLNYSLNSAYGKAIQD